MGKAGTARATHREAAPRTHEMVRRTFAAGFPDIEAPTRNGIVKPVPVCHRLERTVARRSGFSQPLLHGLQYVLEERFLDFQCIS